MKLNHLILVADAVERISEITETNDIPEIVDALVGIAWDEEDAGQIKAYHNGDLTGMDFEGQRPSGGTSQ